MLFMRQLRFTEKSEILKKLDWASSSSKLFFVFKFVTASSDLCFFS